MNDYCIDCGSTESRDLGHGAYSVCCGAPVRGAHFAKRNQRKPLRDPQDEDDR